MISPTTQDLATDPLARERSRGANTSLVNRMQQEARDRMFQRVMATDPRAQLVADQFLGGSDSSRVLAGIAVNSGVLSGMAGGSRWDMMGAINAGVANNGVLNNVVWGGPMGKDRRLNVAGAGAFTDAISYGMLNTLEDQFYTETGGARRNMTSGMDRGDLGKVVAQLGVRGGLDLQGEIKDRNGEMYFEQTTSSKNRVRDTVKASAEAVESLRDIVGPEGVGKVFGILEEIYGDTVSTAVAARQAKDRVQSIKSAARATGVSTEGMLSNVQQSTRIAGALGIGGQLGADIGFRAATRAAYYSTQTKTLGENFSNLGYNVSLPTIEEAAQIETMNQMGSYNEKLGGDPRMVALAYLQQTYGQGLNEDQQNELQAAMDNIKTGTSQEDMRRLTSQASQTFQRVLGISAEEMNQRMTTGEMASRLVGDGKDNLQEINDAYLENLDELNLNQAFDDIGGQLLENTGLTRDEFAETSTSIFKAVGLTGFQQIAGALADNPEMSAEDIVGKITSAQSLTEEERGQLVSDLEAFGNRDASIAAAIGSVEASSDAVKTIRSTADRRAATAKELTNILAQNKIEDQEPLTLKDAVLGGTQISKADVFKTAGDKAQTLDLSGTDEENIELLKERMGEGQILAETVKKDGEDTQVVKFLSDEDYQTALDKETARVGEEFQKTIGGEKKPERFVLGKTLEAEQYTLSERLSLDKGLLDWGTQKDYSWMQNFVTGDAAQSEEAFGRLKEVATKGNIDQKNMLLDSAMEAQAYLSKRVEKEKGPEKQEMEKRLQSVNSIIEALQTKMEDSAGSGPEAYVAQIIAAITALGDRLS